LATAKKAKASAKGGAKKGAATKPKAGSAKAKSAKAVKVATKKSPKTATAKKPAAKKVTKVAKVAKKVAKPAAKKVTKVTKAAKVAKVSKVKKAPKAAKVTKVTKASKAPKVVAKKPVKPAAPPAKISKVDKTPKNEKASAAVKTESSAKASKSKANIAPPVAKSAEPTKLAKGGKFAPAPIAAKPVAAIAPSAPKVVLAPQRALPKSQTVKPPHQEAAFVHPSTTRVAGLLSEADILKQSKDHYMSKDQLAFFKHRLTELASQLRENAGQTTEHLRELAIVPDPADRATLEEEHALELRARDRERKLLKKVEAAILRIDDGSYGYCEETGDPIGIPRLLARPTATLTIEAQERRELKQKMFGE
jgi:DnaK suppressor protein